MKKIGLALGSGGARGLAHILMFEVFEELGIKPSIISGSSIGAIMGASFASGTTSKEIREVVDDLIFHKNSKFWELHKKADITKMFNFVDFGFRAGGIIKGEKLFKILQEEIKAKKFEDLQIPLKIVATDFWKKKEIIMDKGDLHKAVIASFSLPGIFPPVKCKNTLLIDGGLVNPLPYDIIKDECDITVAIDVSANKSKSDGVFPPSYEVLFSAFQIMQNSIVQEKLKFARPDILIRTDIKDIRIHEFLKAETIFEKSQKAKSYLKRKLEKLIEQRKAG